MKAFLFDVDDTLYDQLQPFQRAYLKMFGEPEGVDLERLFSQSRKRGDEVFEASQLGTISMEEMYIYRTQKSFADLELFISPDQALAFQVYYQEFQQKIFLSEECRSMLADLKGRVRLGIITNGPGAHQRNKVKTLGMEEWIPDQDVFVSGELPTAKPDLGIFEYAREQMQLSGEECYYIGDSYENDVCGAVGAGWKCVWFNRRQKPEGAIKPDYMVATEEELHRLLVSLL